MADEAPPALRPADVVAPVLHFVNVSSKPLALYAYADASSPACTAERLMPARVVRCERLAVVEGVLWVEVAGYEDALWLPYDAEALRDRETGPHKAFYRAAHHDVPLYCGPSRTAALCGDVVAKYESARFDLTKLVGHELWGRIDDRVSDVSAGERWACISDRVEDHRDFLQLEPFQLTGYFVNIFAAHHNGQLPAREAPSLDATKVCGVPDWIAFKAGAVALVPIATKRSKSGINETSLKHSPVGLLWARIRVVHKGSTLECWTIEANANTGIIVLESCPPPHEGAQYFRNVDSRGASAIVEAPAARDALPGKGKEASARCALGACVRVRETTVTAAGQLWARVEEPAAGWSRLVSPTTGEALLKKVSPPSDAGDDSTCVSRLYHVVEQLRGALGADADALPQPEAYFVSNERELDTKGQMWVRAPGDNLALESAGGVKDSFREIEFAAGRVVELGPYDVENQRDAYNEKEASKAAASKAAMRTRRASPPPARAGREAFEGNPTQLLAALDDFADAAILADKQLKASRASRNADRASRDEALKAAMSASGGSRGADDESLLMEVVPRLATPMIAVRSVTKRRVSCFGGRHVLRVAVDVIYGAGGSHEALAHTALLRAELVQASETAAVFAKVEQGRDMVSDCAQRAAAGDAAFSLKLRFAAGQDDAPRVATFSLDEKRFFDSTNGATTAAKRTGRPRRGRTRRGGDDRGVEFTVLGGEDPSADDEDGAVVLLLRAVAYSDDAKAIQPSHVAVAAFDLHAFRDSAAIAEHPCSFAARYLSECFRAPENDGAVPIPLSTRLDRMKLLGKMKRRKGTPTYTPLANHDDTDGDLI